MYGTEDQQMFLIPTAEVPVTNLYRDTILQESDLPIKMAAYTALPSAGKPEAPAASTAA